MSVNHPNVHHTDGQRHQLAQPPVVGLRTSSDRTPYNRAAVLGPRPNRTTSNVSPWVSVSRPTASSQRRAIMAGPSAVSDSEGWVKSLRSKTLPQTPPSSTQPQHLGETSRGGSSRHKQLVSSAHANVIRPTPPTNLGGALSADWRRLKPLPSTPNTSGRPCTNTPATHVHGYELEIARWQSHRRTKHGASRLPCSVCLEVMDPSIWSRPTARCTHEPRICKPCLTQYIKHAIQEEGLTELSCPDPGCRHKIDNEDITTYIQGDEALFARFSELAAQRELEKHPNFVYCTNPTCSRGQLHVEGAASPRVTCHYCDKTFCFVHRSPGHDNLTCEEYEDLVKRQLESQNHASEEYIAQHTKRCPNSGCGRPIEKIDGCDHLTCRPPGGCGHEFCWECLADYGPIRGDGNHRHKPDCKHYAAYGSLNLPRGMRCGVRRGLGGPVEMHHPLPPQNQYPARRFEIGDVQMVVPVPLARRPTPERTYRVAHCGFSRARSPRTPSP